MTISKDQAIQKTFVSILYKGAFNSYVDKGGRGQIMSVFVHAQGIETVHAEGGGGQKTKNGKILSV